MKNIVVPSVHLYSCSKFHVECTYKENLLIHFKCHFKFYGRESVTNLFIKILNRLTLNYEQNLAVCIILPGLKLHTFIELAKTC